MTPPAPKISIRHLATLLCLITALLVVGCGEKVVIKTPSPQTPKEVKLDGPTLLAQAEKALIEGQYDKSRAAFTEYLNRFPSGPNRSRATLGLGRSALGLNDYQAAIKWFREYLTVFPASAGKPWAQLGLAQALLGQNNPLRALEALIGLKAETGSPDIQTRYYILKAEARFMLNEPKSALDSLVAGFKSSQPDQKPNFVGALGQLTERWSEEQLLELALLYDSPFPTVHLVAALADKALAEQNWTKALKYQSRLQEDFPGHPVTLAKTRGLNWSNLPPGKEWTLGCLVPLSGPLAQYGEKLLEGMQLAAGVFDPNSPFKLIIEDTANDPLVTTEAMERLALAGDAVAIIGPLSARLAKTGAEKAGELEIPLVTLTQNRQVARISPWALRNFITPEDQIEALAQRVVEDLELKRVAILHPELDYGRRMAQLMLEAVTRYGGQVMTTRAYPADTADLAGQLLAMGGTAPDTEELKSLENPERQPKGPNYEAMFIPDSFGQAAQIAPQLAFYDLTDTVLLGTNLWHDPELINLARDYVQGALIPTNFFPDSEEPMVRSFVRRFVETYGHAPDLFNALGYDAVRLVVDVITHQGVEERRALLEALLATRDYPGITGLTRFNEQGEAVKEPYIITVKGNRFVLAPLWPDPTQAPGEVPAAPVVE